MFRVLAKTAPTLRNAFAVRFMSTQVGFASVWVPNRSFLPVEEVTKRMMDVVKNFDAVDANKVSCVVLVVPF